ncbi:MAG: thermonuclease family protein [Chloroflexota bacterium]
MRLILLVVLLLLGGCPLAPAEPTLTSTVRVPATPTPAGGLAGRVVDVVDGDTLKVDLGGRTETVRVIGIDTPESVSPREPVQCFGLEASARADELLRGRSVALTQDPSQDSRDQYGRLLAYVEVAGQDFGLAMIADGYAHEYTYDVPYRRQAEYRAAQRAAQGQRVGLWSSATCGGDTTAAAASTPTAAPAQGSAPPLSRLECPPSHPVKGNVTATDRIYHVAGSSSYAGTVPEICFATPAAAAAAGFHAPGR